MDTLSCIEKHPNLPSANCETPQPRSDSGGKFIQAQGSATCPPMQTPASVVQSSSARQICPGWRSSRSLYRLTGVQVSHLTPARVGRRFVAASQAGCRAIGEEPRDWDQAGNYCELRMRRKGGLWSGIARATHRYHSPARLECDHRSSTGPACACARKAGINHV